MKPKCCDTNNSLEELNKLVDFLKTIADKNRLKILCMLREEEKCVCEIWKFLNLPQNLASHHLKVLRDLRLIKPRKEGLKIYYSVNQQELTKYNLRLKKFLQ